ncbi:MAG: YbjN domain-containing protein [Bacteroidales bacterium]|nr:YbjN domain-containing protein [Bacteroidales bacterium]
MKRSLLLLSLIMLLLPCSMPAGAELSTEVKTFRTNLTKFLREEGYSPTSNSDGSRIDFEHGGLDYFIYLSGSMPVQVTMRVEGLSNEDTNPVALLMACNDINKDAYYVKTYITELGDEGSTMIVIEMPCHTAEEYRYVFYDCVKALSKARQDIIDKYTEYEEQLGDTSASSSSSSSSSSSASRSTAGVTFVGCTAEDIDHNENHIKESEGAKIRATTAEYVFPNVKIKCTNPGTYKIKYKLFGPNGQLIRRINAEQGFSSEEEDIELRSGTEVYNLKGCLGPKNNNYFDAGNYKFEIYLNGKLFGTYNFRIY